VPANGNDGLLTTRWAAANNTYPQWWQVDLGTSHSLSQVVINWYNSSSRAYQYQIETSNDNVTFTTVVDQTARTSTGDSTDNFSATGRYVRITVTGVIGGGWASFWESQVMEHRDAHRAVSSAENLGWWPTQARGSLVWGTKEP